jgi:hypothetical protein
VYVCGGGTTKRGATYNYEAADRDQVPDYIFSPLEFGVSLFQLAQVLERPHGVEDESNLGATKEEGCYGPPYFRRES